MLTILSELKHLMLQDCAHPQNLQVSPLRSDCHFNVATDWGVRPPLDTQQVS